MTEQNPPTKAEKKKKNMRRSYLFLLKTYEINIADFVFLQLKIFS